MASRKLSHAIADIRFEDLESTLICQCGWDESAGSPEVLNDRYQEHRVDLGLGRGSVTSLAGLPANDFWLRQGRG